MNPIVTVLIMVACSEVAFLTNGDPRNKDAKGKPVKGFSMRPVLAGFVVGVFLYGLDVLNHDLAKKMSLLVIVAAVLVNGQPLLKLMTNAANRTAPTAAQAATQKKNVGLIGRTPTAI